MLKEKQPGKTPTVPLDPKLKSYSEPMGLFSKDTFDQEQIIQLRKELRKGIPQQGEIVPIPLAVYGQGAIVPLPNAKPGEGTIEPLPNAKSKDEKVLSKEDLRRILEEGIESGRIKINKDKPVEVTPNNS